MRAYFISIGNRAHMPVKAENIDNLRRNLIRDYAPNMKAGAIIYVYVLSGPEYGASYKPIGRLFLHENQAWKYDTVPTAYFWNVKNKAKRVSPKTGKLMRGLHRCRHSP